MIFTTYSEQLLYFFRVFIGYFNDELSTLVWIASLVPAADETDYCQYVDPFNWYSERIRIKEPSL